MKIAITGGIAAGKSTVYNRLLAKLQGYYGISIDMIVAQIYDDMADPSKLDVTRLRENLIRQFGTIDKSKLSKLMLSDPTCLSTIETLFSSYIEKRLDQELSLGDVICEFPLLVEKGNAHKFDFIINVEASQSVKHTRASSRPAMTDEKFSFIVKRQAVNDQRRAIASYTFVNETLSDLEFHTSMISLRIKNYGIRTGIVSGSFDPITNGHLHLISKALEMMIRVVVVVAYNPKKAGMFSADERVQMVMHSCVAHNLPMERLSVIQLPPNEMVVTVAAAIGANYIIRGLRNSTDFEYEQQIDLVQTAIAPQINTLYLMTPRELTEVSSSMVKSIHGLSGWEKIAKLYVPDCALEGLKGKLNESKL